MYRLLWPKVDWTITSIISSNDDVGFACSLEGEYRIESASNAKRAGTDSIYHGTGRDLGHLDQGPTATTNTSSAANKH